MHRIMVYRQRTQARVGNSTIRNRHADIEILLTDAGTIPPHFPQDFEALGNASAGEINGLLMAYNQPVHGNLDMKRNVSQDI
ncbi:hypothetical protein C1645_786334 [Glomus cerebriforme]|uniref:Uncharacterized protein n=1 Tax=Glomus cerebriforme TaxID=658196 RepID=A0A397SAT1_9GLOM|nr:hypothetical protein C1645_786334 [Glomus cerebriforme]